MMVEVELTNEAKMGKIIFLWEIGSTIQFSGSDVLFEHEFLPRSLEMCW